MIGSSLLLGFIRQQCLAKALLESGLGRSQALVLEGPGPAGPLMQLPKDRCMLAIASQPSVSQ